MILRTLFNHPSLESSRRSRLLPQRGGGHVDSQPLRHPHPVRNLYHPRQTWIRRQPGVRFGNGGMHDTRFLLFRGLGHGRIGRRGPSWLLGLRPFPPGSAGHVHQAPVAHFLWPSLRDLFTLLLRENHPICGRPE